MVMAIEVAYNVLGLPVDMPPAVQGVSSSNAYDSADDFAVRRK